MNWFYKNRFYKHYLFFNVEGKEIFWRNFTAPFVIKHFFRDIAGIAAEWWYIFFLVLDLLFKNTTPLSEGGVNIF